MTIQDVPKMSCCEHVSLDSFAAVVQENEETPPYVSFANLPKSGVLELSF